MSESDELKQIKKLYGEKFMHLCRELFPTILENEGELLQILKKSFATNSKTLYEDITEEMLEKKFKNYIYSKRDAKNEKPKIINKKTPYELLEEAGYDLYECTSEEEIQSFRKYYMPGEELCTFHGGRLGRCVVFWAVKKNAEEIIREDFDKPKREDEYGTSVMSIQFSRGDGNSTVSIKNRYNHTVNNPDATYGNDLDRIIPGLEQSFADLLAEKGYKLNNSNIERLTIPGYTVGPDGRYYKYNIETHGKYYCPGNIIIDHIDIIQLEPEKQLLIDYFILDKENKTLKTYDKELSEDSFLYGFKDIKTIQVEKNAEKEKGTRRITIQFKDSDTPIIIEIDKDNQIIGYNNERLRYIGDDFLSFNNRLSQLNLPNLIGVGNNFLLANKELIQLELPNLEEVGDCFLRFNQKLEQLDLPKLTEVGDDFLNYNQELSQLNLPSLKQVGNYFLYWNSGLSELYLPNLEQVGDCFLIQDHRLNELDLPNLTKVGIRFLFQNNRLDLLELPKLAKVGDAFLYNNQRLSQLYLPNLEQVGDYFLYANQKLNRLELPKLKRVGDYFIYENKELSQLNLPNLEQVGESFLSSNQEISLLELPNLTKVGDYFLWDNEKLNLLGLSKFKGHSKITKLLYKTRVKKIINRINKKNIADLDKENQLTTSEISSAGKFIQKIREWMKDRR